MKKTALLFGATGLVGKNCMEALLRSEAYQKVVVFVRRPTFAAVAKLQEVVIDYDRLSDAASYIKGDDVFICLGTTAKKAGSKAAFYKVDFTYSFEAAKIAAINGAQQLQLVSSIGANAHSLVHYSQVKGEIEQAVRALPYATVRIFRPSVLLGHRDELRLGEQVGANVGSFLHRISGSLLNKYAPIAAIRVADCMVAAAQCDEPKGFYIIENDVLLSDKYLPINKQN